MISIDYELDKFQAVIDEYHDYINAWHKQAEDANDALLRVLPNRNILGKNFRITH